MVKKFYLDTNTIAHHIILSNIIKRKKIKVGKNSKFKRYLDAHELIEKIIRKKATGNFFSSPLALTELYFAIFEEYKCEKMYNEGIPLSSWNSNKRKMELSKEEIAEIQENILSFSDDNICDNDDGYVKPIFCTNWDAYDYDLLPELVFEKNIRTHDALLLATANDEGADYFVTSDKELRRIIK